MTDALSKFEVAINCPKCSKKFKRTIGQLKRDGNSCPHCGVHFDSKQFRKEIDKVEASFRDFLK